MAPMWVSLAGPTSNLLMAVLMSIPFWFGLASYQQAMIDMATAQSHFLPTLDQFLLVFISTNLLLMLFNLIPLAPLDGEKILYYLLPFRGQQVMDQIRPYGPILLLMLVFAGFLIPGLDLLDRILYPALNALLNLLVG